MATTSYLGIFNSVRRPGAGVGIPVLFWDDFIGPHSVPDLALSAESNPSAQFSEVANRGHWLVSGDALGSAGSTNFPLSVNNGDGGWFSMRSPAVAGQRTQVQLNGEPFRFTNTYDGAQAKDRPLYFESKIRVSTDTDCDAFFGLASSTTDAHADIVAATAGHSYVGFSLSGDADVEAAVGTAVDNRVDTGVDYVFNQFHTYGFLWDGREQVHWYFDGVEVHRTAAALPVESTSVLTIPMSPVICVEANTGLSETVSVDYLLVVMERA